jgi:CRP/FNR family transcriptional regulator
MRDLVAALQSRGTKRTFKKGSVLLYQGEAPRMAYMLQSGNVKVYTINNAGEEQIVTMHSEPDMFPSPWIFKNATTTPYYYETMSQCDIITLPRDILRTLMFKPEHMPGLIDYLATNYVGMMMRTTALQQSRASEKIMFTFYYLLFRYGRETAKAGLYKIDLQLTHNIIASLVGLTRETTTTELNNLKKQGIISYARHIYVVNKHKLERSLGEDSFAEVML